LARIAAGNVGRSARATTGSVGNLYICRGAKRGAARNALFLFVFPTGGMKLACEWSGTRIDAGDDEARQG
jgi:hypothetical protein